MVSNENNAEKIKLSHRKLSDDYSIVNDFDNDNQNETVDHPHSRQKRQILVPAHHLLENNEYTMEVLVAVDRKMQEYHGNNIREYVLTLMSIVSSIYADASIGNSINVAVVHILLLKDDLRVESNHAGELLAQINLIFFVNNFNTEHVNFTITKKLNKLKPLPSTNM